MTLAAACGSSSDKRKDPTAYPGNEDGGDGNGNGTSGKTNTPGGQGTGDGSAGDTGAAAAAGNGAGGATEDGAGGDVALGGATAGAGAPGTDGGVGGTGGTGGTNEPVADPGRGRTGPLLLQVTTPQGPAVPGESMLWSITVGNTSGATVKGVSVLFRVPLGLSFASTVAVPTSSSCGNGQCSANEEATWQLGDMPGGTTQTIQLTAAVQGSLVDGTTLEPSIRLNATDLDTLTLLKTVPVSVAPPVEVTLGSTADPVVQGDVVELAVDLGHIGKASLFTGALRLVLPTGLEVLSTSDAGTQPSEPDDEPQINDVLWSIDTIPVGDSLRRFVTAKVVGGVPGDILNPKATFTYENAVIAHEAQVPLSIVADAPPLLLHVTPSAEPIVPGGYGHYEVTVSNPSARAVDGIELRLRVPAELGFSSAASSEPDEVSGCGNGYCADTELGRWDIGTLAAGASQTVSIAPSVVASAAPDGSLASTAFQLRAVGVGPIHVFKSVSVHTKPAAQLVLGVNASPVVPGQTFTYDLDLGSVGTASLLAAALKLELPAGVVAGTPSDGGVVANGVVSWSLGAIALNGVGHRSVPVTVSAGVAPGSLLGARASLTFDKGPTLDAVSEFTTAVAAETLPLSVTLTALPSPATISSTFSYTTVIKNNADHTIDGVELVLRLPTKTTFSSTGGADPDSSSCGNGSCAEGEEATWDVGSIAAGASKNVNINPLAGAQLTPGSLLSLRQHLTAADLGGTILLQTTVPTKAAPTN